LTANVFDVEITDPIVYFYSGSSNYANFDQTASQGVEFSSIYKKDTTNVTLTYSYYKARDNEVTEYKIPNHSDALLGFPSHKISLLASVSPYKNVFVTPTLTWYSPRYAVTGYESDYVYKKLDSKILANISLLFKDAFKKKGLDLSFSVFNLLDEEYDFIEPYLGWYGPVPSPSRAFVFKLMYRF
jgi:outer membrane cobalamin receptor